MAEHTIDSIRQITYYQKMDQWSLYFGEYFRSETITNDQANAVISQANHDANINLQISEDGGSAIYTMSEENDYFSRFFPDLYAAAVKKNEINEFYGGRVLKPSERFPKGSIPRSTYRFNRG